MKTCTYEQALHKAASLCSRSEQCTHDIEQKLETWGVELQDRSRVIERLVQEKFLSDERFARSYINDKYKYSRWGRIKIQHHLKTKGISRSTFQEQAQEAIDENTYFENLQRILQEKLRTTQGKTPFEVKQKLIRFASARGYELDLILHVVDDIIQGKTHDD